MAIKYIHPATGETATKEPWRWVAVFKDGTALEQFEVRDGKATFHRFAEIDQSKLISFIMTHDSHPSLTLSFDPETMELQHFYRNQILATPTGGRDNDGNPLVEHRRERLYCFGYKQSGVIHLTQLLPDGRVIITNNPDEVVDLTS